MEPRLLQLLPEGAGAEGVDKLPVQTVLPQVPDQGVHGGEEVLRRGPLDAHVQQPLHIGPHSPGGVVGYEQVPSAPLPHPAEKVQGAVKQVVSQVDGPVHVQQEQFLLLQVRLPSLLSG